MSAPTEDVRLLLFDKQETKIRKENDEETLVSFERIVLPVIVDFYDDRILSAVLTSTHRFPVVLFRFVT